MSAAEWQDVTVPMPADVEQPDKIVAGLTARQAGILAAVTIVLWAAYTTLGDLVALPVLAAVAIPVIAVALLVSLGRRDGVSLDRWLLAAVRHAAAPRRHVPATGAPVGGGQGRGAPAPLPSPVAAVGDDGVVDLGGDCVVVLACEPVNFSLRSPGEQAALVAALARWLHAASHPVQILVRCTPVDLSPVLDRLVAAAPALPHPALEAAAVGHARFLAELAAGREILHRDVLVAVRGPRAQVTHAAAQAASALAAAEVRARQLDAREVTQVLAACADPYAPGYPPGTGGPVFGGVIAGPADWDPSDPGAGRG